MSRRNLDIRRRGRWEEREAERPAREERHDAEMQAAAKATAAGGTIDYARDDELDEQRMGSDFQ